MPRKKKNVSVEDSMLVTTPTANIEREETGWLSLDCVLGGGLPYGSVVLVGGREDIGKTNFALHVVANAVKKGKRVLYFDVENRLCLNPQRLQARRITPEEAKLIEIVPGDNAIENVMAHIRARVTTSKPEDVPRVVVIDSVASLHARAFRLLRAENQSSGVGVASTARVLTDESKDIFTYYALKYNVLFILTTQLRSSPQTMSLELYGARYIRHIAATIIRLNSTTKPPSVDFNDFIPAEVEKRGVKKAVYTYISAKLDKNQLSPLGAQLSVITRVFHMSIPKFGINIGDYDNLLEILMYGRGRGEHSFVIRQGDVFTLKHSGTSFTIVDAYRNPDLRAQIIAEGKEQLQKMFNSLLEDALMEKVERDIAKHGYSIPDGEDEDSVDDESDAGESDADGSDEGGI